jgi:NAD-dependent SIR2 family protein deacetylase
VTGLVRVPDFSGSASTQRTGPVSASDPAEAIALLREHRFVALTGAGMSTDSGIPDYRGPGTVRRTGGRTPMTFQEFCSGPRAQQRYWARAYVGWALMRDALPNDGHHALARLEAVGRCGGVITQNVDGLHEQAGTGGVVALHGRITDVVCLSCRDRTARAVVQREMAAANPGWLEAHREALTEVHARPDGDAELDDTAAFAAPTCDRCGGALKPDVVFFGENVPRRRVERCHALIESAECLVVLGSSLTVMSGFRFVRHARSLGTPVVIVNRGATRGDGHATYKLEHGTTEFLCHPAWSAAQV